ncbi:protein neprosin-like [Magnolia sinica]|uniref:protein neprosin-like n=1 Tax=Magnolia sinica TaxID=86752 RepID=UPI002659003B|nr:protein neprosin-like [Magnolia sinica]
MKRELKRLNKPAVESIQTEYGDIFDCVDIYKQPAFDHPSLKNHIIQVSLSFFSFIGHTPRFAVIRQSYYSHSYPKGMENKHPSNTNLEFGLKEGGCPFGTIPIRRTTMQDLLRAKSLSDFGRKPATDVTHHTIGCYNLLCPGFVQVSKDIALGSFLRTSVYNGDQQEEVTLAVFKSIFTSLADKSTGTDWGGETCTPEGIKSPPMGSGQFPDEGFKKASYMRRLQYVDNTYTFKDIPNTFKDVPNDGFVYSDLQCYKLNDGGNLGGFWDRNFFFGGPGGC